MKTNSQQRKDLIIKAVETFGRNSQLEMLVEECSELIQAVQKYKRSDYIGDKQFLNLCEEIADVKIMIEQIEYIIGTREIEAMDYMKIKRLKELIKNETNQIATLQ